MNRGFTLVELMVVMLILGVVMGLALLAPRAESHPQTLQQAERLQQLFSRLRDRALLEHSEYGFSVEGSDRYQWWRLSSDQQQWHSLEAAPFQPFRLPDSMALHLQVQEPGAKKNSNSALTARLQPDVVIFSDQQLTPLYLTLSSERHTTTLISDGLSDVVIQP